MDGRTIGHLTHVIRSTLRSRPKKGDGRGKLGIGKTECTVSNITMVLYHSLKAIVYSHQSSCINAT